MVPAFAGSPPHQTLGARAGRPPFKRKDAAPHAQHLVTWHPHPGSLRRLWCRCPLRWGCQHLWGHQRRPHRWRHRCPVVPRGEHWQPQGCRGPYRDSRQPIRWPSHPRPHHLLLWWRQNHYWAYWCPDYWHRHECRCWCTRRHWRWCGCPPCR